MAQLLVALGVWAIWSVLQSYIEAPNWFWKLLPLALGVGGQCLLDPSDWWLGVGIGGLAMAFMLVGDLLLVTTDWVRVAVLRHQRRA